jgi:site-specific recombinase XerD
VIERCRSAGERVRAGNGNKARSFPLNYSARDALAIYAAARLGLGEEEKVPIRPAAANWPKPGSPQALDPLWLVLKGGALTTSAIGQMMAELVNAAGKLVPQETSAHSLRHTFARSYLA